MSGWLKVVGLGPGDPAWMTPEASVALGAASDLVGYGPYVERVAEAGQVRHASDNRVEMERAQLALTLAASGKRVAVVSSGDPGIFAMAAAVMEAVDTGDPAWGGLDIEVLPGVSAMQAAAARLGAPLGHDFCVISLSDNLKPWSIIERRLRVAIEADFVVALYNPASRSRPTQIETAFAIAREVRNGATPVMLARAVGSADERITVATLESVDASLVDMRTLVLIGSSTTRLVPRAGKPPFVYTPRSYEVAE